MPLFRKGPGPFALPLAMIGVKMGDRLLQLGAGDGRLFAALAGKVGLTGRACAVDDSADVASRARRAAANAGVLVEIEVGTYAMLPYENEAFDLVIVRDLIASMYPNDRVRCLQEAHRVLRPGGRLLVVEPADRGGLAGALARRAKNPTYVTAGGAEGALRAEGFKGARLLAEREGTRFVEAMKTSSPS